MTEEIKINELLDSQSEKGNELIGKFNRSDLNMDELLTMIHTIEESEENERKGVTLQLLHYCYCVGFYKGYIRNKKN